MESYMKENDLYPQSFSHFRRTIPKPPAKKLKEIMQELDDTKKAMLEGRIEKELGETWFKAHKTIHRPTQEATYQKPYSKIGGKVIQEEKTLMDDKELGKEEIQELEKKGKLMKSNSKKQP
jgi:hypothetical protein